MRPLVVLVTLLAVTAPIGAAAVVGANGGAADRPSADAADLTDTVTITVSVVDGSDAPIVDAEVTATWDGGEDTRTTVGNGKAYVTVPDDRDLEITVDHPDYVRNTPAEVSNVAEGQEVVVTMTRPASETVTVVDGDGTPVRDATVRLTKIGQIRSVASGTTGEDGTYAATGIEEGDYVVRVSRSGFDRARQEVEVAGDANHTVEIERNSTTVSFRVTDGRLGDGLQSRITVRNDGEDVLSFRTGEDGRLQQLLPVNTRYRIVVERDGYRRTEGTLRVNERSTSASFTINRTDALTLSAETSQVLAGNSLRVTVTDEYDERVAGATITVDGESVATTDENGVATVRLDETGEYDLVATEGGVEADPVTIQAVQAATSTAEPTTAAPTTADPTTAAPTTADPTTARPTVQSTTESPAETTAAPATTEESGGGSPGFLVPTAVGALVLTLALLRRRR